MNGAHSLRIVVFTLAFVFGAVSCANARAMSEIDRIGFNAKNVPEGILLSFNYIPPETTRMFIHIESTDTKNPIDSFADIYGSQLEQLKNTKMITFPYVQVGQSYSIAVNFELEGRDNSDNWLYAEITALNGIHLVNDITLQFNHTQTGVLLTAEPLFSSNVEYAQEKFMFHVSVKLSDNSTIVYGEKVSNGLSWEFLSRLIQDLRKDEIGISGDFAAFVTAYCRINYEDVIWDVGIAVSKEFIVSL
jgi:hypothetical protein